MAKLRAVHLAVCALATWRVTSLLVNEDGPFDVFAKLRFIAGARADDWQEQTFLGGLFGCFWCMSVWVAAFVALVAVSPLRWMLTPLALSGAAILAERVAGDG